MSLWPCASASFCRSFPVSQAAFSFLSSVTWSILRGRMSLPSAVRTQSIQSAPRSGPAPVRPTTRALTSPRPVSPLCCCGFLRVLVSLCGCVLLCFVLNYVNEPRDPHLRHMLGRYCCSMCAMVSATSLSYCTPAQCVSRRIYCCQMQRLAPDPWGGHSCVTSYHRGSW